MAGLVDALWISLALLVLAMLAFGAATTVDRPVLRELRVRRREAPAVAEVPVGSPRPSDIWT